MVRILWFSCFIFLNSLPVFVAGLLGLFGGFKPKRKNKADGRCNCYGQINFMKSFQGAGIGSHKSTGQGCTDHDSKTADQADQTLGRGPFHIVCFGQGHISHRCTEQSAKTYPNNNLKSDKA